MLFVRERRKGRKGVVYLLFDEMQWPLFDFTVVVDFRIRGKPGCIEGFLCFFSRRGAEYAEEISI